MVFRCLNMPTLFGVSGDVSLKCSFNSLIVVLLFIKKQLLKLHFQTIYVFCPSSPELTPENGLPSSFNGIVTILAMNFFSMSNITFNSYDLYYHT